MAIYQWPESTLPAPSNVFAGQIDSATIRSTLDSGETRQRNRFSAETSIYQVTWQFTDSERAIFKAVVKHKLNSGADWFMISLPVNFGLETVKARIINGSYSEQHNLVLNWDVSVTLECVEVPAWSEFVVDTLVYFGEVGATLEEYEAATSALYLLLNTTIPLTLPK